MRERHKDAKRLRTRLLAQAESLQSSRTSATLGYLLDRRLPQHDIDEHTKSTSESLIRRRSWRPGMVVEPYCTAVIGSPLA